MRFVFDTNVVVSALLFEQSRPAQAFFGALQREEILLSTDLVNEISRVIHREKFDRYVSQE
jgi:predicted nucleic acid-binding protein